MGQQISHCRTGTEPSVGSFEPHIIERRKRRLPGTVPKSLPGSSNNDDNTALSRATVSTTGLSSSKTSFCLSSPLGSSGGTTGSNGNGNDSNPATHNFRTNHVIHPLPLRYKASTRNPQDPCKEAAATTTASTQRSLTHNEANTKPLRTQQHQRKCQRFLRQQSAPADKRSNPVKFPRKRHTYECPMNLDKRNDTSANPDTVSHSQEVPQDASYLERMYDSRTWEMYRRITSHREKVEAFNAANAAAKRENDDDRNSTNRTYMSEPVHRVTNSSTMEGGVDYDNFYDPDTDNDEDSREGGVFLLEDHSAPPYRYHRHCDNGQHHHGILYPPSDRYHSNNVETYSEWEHMNGDDMEVAEVSGKNSKNEHGGQHETIFLFDF